MTRMWAVVLVLSSCAVPFEDYARRYAITMCEREVRCGLREPVDCGGVRTQRKVELLALETRWGWKRYQPEEGARCLALLDEAPCSARPEFTVACQSVFEGTLQEGEQCFPNDDLFETSCAPDLFCETNSLALCGTCTRPDEGERWCKPGFGPPWGDTPCQRLPERGEPCLVTSLGSWCAPGYVCNADSRCEWPEKQKPRCTSIYESGFMCDHHVLERLDGMPEGSPCESHATCALEMCNEGRCRREQFTCG